MASGVQVSDEVVEEYKYIKKGKKYRYMVYHIKEEKKICIDSSGDRDSKYQDFLDYLESVGPDECRYGLYDFEFEHACEGAADTTRSKLILMIWCPDTARIKKKMLYSSSFDALKQSLEGIGKYIQATDMSEAAPECILEKIKSTARS
uniref:Cofilin/actin-depolymerizing factor homolog n=1 Tax=Hirondellea gigas TaxID=1518452 RepID=A0A6A7FMC1_9CRUS